MCGVEIGCVGVDGGFCGVVGVTKCWHYCGEAVSRVRDAIVMNEAMVWCCVWKHACVVLRGVEKSVCVDVVGVQSKDRVWVRIWDR